MADVTQSPKMSSPSKRGESTRGLHSPTVMRGSTKTPGATATGKALASSQQSQEAKKVAALCEAGLAFYNQKKYDEAEEAWKSALQISQNDTRTLMHYSVFLRDVRGKPDVAEQLLQQATGDGDWHQYISPMTEQNREAELWRKPVLSSPVKDMKKMEHIKSMARSHVQFYALKTLKKQVERLEYDERTKYGDGDDEEGEDGEYEYGEYEMGEMGDESMPTTVKFLGKAGE